MPATAETLQPAPDITTGIPGTADGAPLALPQGNIPPSTPEGPPLDPFAPETGAETRVDPTLVQGIGETALDGAVRGGILARFGERFRDVVDHSVIAVNGLRQASAEGAARRADGQMQEAQAILPYFEKSTVGVPQHVPGAKRANKAQMAANIHRAEGLYRLEQIWTDKITKPGFLEYAEAQRSAGLWTDKQLRNAKKALKEYGHTKHHVEHTGIHATHEKLKATVQAKDAQAYTADQRYIRLSGSIGQRQQQIEDRRRARSLRRQAKAETTLDESGLDEDIAT